MIERLKDLFFTNRSTRQTITKNIFWLGVSQVGSRLIRAVIIIYAARVLGASEYGVFSYAMGLAAFFTIFADIGVSSIMTKEVSQKPEEGKKYFATSFWLKSVLIIFTCLLVFFGARHFSNIEAAKPLISLITILIVFDNLRDFSFAFFRAKEKMEYEALIMLSMNIAIMAFGFIALYLSPTALSLTISYVSSAGAGFLLALFALRKEFLGVFKHFTKSLAKPIISSAYPYAFVNLLGAFMTNVDVIMLGWFKSASEIGLYSSGQRIVQIFYGLSIIITTATFPALSRAVGEKNREKVSFLMEKGMALAFMIAVPIAIGGIILSKPILSLLYGAEYVPASLSFQILLLTILIVIPGFLLGNLVLAYDKQKKMALYIGIASAGNVLLNYLLIPKYGIAGAAFTTLLVQIVYYGQTWSMIKKVNNFFLIPHVKKIFFSSVLMGFFTFILADFGLNVIINIIISAGFYFGLLYAFKEPMIEEIKSLFKAVKRNNG
jgi:O-antigen/teichoic acid export membrane protein